MPSLTNQRFFRLAVFAHIVFESILSHFRLQSNHRTYIAYLNGMHFQECSKNGLIAGKLDYWLKVLESNAIKGSTCLNPFSVRPIEKTAGFIDSTEYLLPVVILKVIFKPKSLHFLDEIDSERATKHSFLNRVIALIYFRHLTQVRPSVVLGIGLNPILCLVARDLNIPTVEFQHGVGIKSEFAKIGVNEIRPDFAFLWDRHFKLGLDNSNQLHVIGYPVDEFPRPREGSEGDRKRILLSLSYGEKNSEDETGFMHVDLYKSLLLLKSAGFEITIRPHPASLSGLEVSKGNRAFVESFLPWVESNPVFRNIRFDYEGSLLGSIAMHDLHLTYASSVALEAAYCGIPSYMLCNQESLPNFPNELIENNTIAITSVGSLLEDLSKTKIVSAYRNQLDQELFLKVINNLL